MYSFFHSFSIYLLHKVRLNDPFEIKKSSSRRIDQSSHANTEANIIVYYDYFKADVNIIIHYEYIIAKANIIVHFEYMNTKKK